MEASLEEEQFLGGEGELDEEAVEKWLRRNKLLLAVGEGVVVAKSPTTKNVSSSDSSFDDNENDEWQKPCAEYGGRYPHQHIRSLHVRRDNDSSDA